ncbi:MAG: hypothetical protein NTX65_10105 [Ignavibacteriales bacterium]|nr:hypothetical protein [Ignavibacteriales bacterium]
MKSYLKFFLFFLLTGVSLTAQNKTNDSTVEKYLPKLEKIFELHEKVKQIHPVLQNVYPVAIAEEGQYYIFEPDTNNRYRFVKKAATTSLVPKGIRAAFPLPENDNKMTCVVTGEVFDSMDGYAIIFHEFVHCAVFAAIEMILKDNLEIYKRAMEQKDWMWELNYAFPYSKKEFTEPYAALLSMLNKNDLNDVKDIRETIKEQLSKDEYSYMTWVEWKEGFARWVENKIRDKFGIKENHAGGIEPFDRVTFYEGGSRLIELIYKTDPKTVLDLEKLYAFINS